MGISQQVTPVRRAPALTRALRRAHLVMLVITPLIVLAAARPARACGWHSDDASDAGDDDDHRPSATATSSRREPVRHREWWVGFVPGLSAVSYRPTKGPAWRGVGASLTLVGWMANGHRSGSLGFDVAVLGTGAGSTGVSADATPPDDGRRMTMWRFAADSSFERSARPFLLPYWSVGAGAITEAALGDHSLLDASVGVHVVRTRRVMLDVAAGLVLPLDAADRLVGSRIDSKLVIGLW
ncbi:MAG: hypothetical protein IT370_04730 [Deltaproteobacteria bacterium]|nr:hypothetical protein [Deltaproteobacteria bacterium]